MRPPRGRSRGRIPVVRPTGPEYSRKVVRPPREARDCGRFGQYFPSDSRGAFPASPRGKGPKPQNRKTRKRLRQSDYQRSRG